MTFGIWRRARGSYILRSMGHPLLDGRFLRLAAIALSLLSVSRVLSGADSEEASRPEFVAWLGAYGAYVVALWLSFSPARQWQSMRARLGLLAVKASPPS